MARRIDIAIVEGTMDSTYKWHELYEAAVLETDWSRMEERIQTAEAAIKERLHEFSLNRGGTPEENGAIVETLERLNALRGDVASWRKRNQAS
jgi:hypothetical protein